MYNGSDDITQDKDSSVKLDNTKNGEMHAKPSKKDSLTRTFSAPSARSYHAFFNTQHSKSENNPLFSVHIRYSIKLQGFLKVDANTDGLVFIMNNLNFQADRVLACNKNKEEGEILIRFLDLDIHSSNIYLELMTLIVDHPNLLITLLNSKYTQFPNHIEHLITLLTARRILPNALKILFQLELNNILQSKTVGEFLRLETDSVKVMTQVIKSSKALNKFSTSFTNYLSNYLITLKNNKRDPSKNLLLIIKKILDYFKLLKDEDFPAELIMILSTLKEVCDRNRIESTNSSKFLGSVFFLRFICPALIQSAELTKELAKISLATTDISKVLQSISNQTPLQSTDHNKLFSSRVKDIEDLYMPVVTLLNRMASLPMTYITIPHSLVRLAASYYWFIIRIVNVTDEATLLSLKILQDRLGSVPQGPLSEKDKIPMEGHIDQISNFISNLTSKRASKAF